METKSTHRKVQLPHGNPGASYLRPGFASQGVTRGAGGRAGTRRRARRAGGHGAMVLLQHGGTGERGGLGAGRGLLPEPLPVPKRRVAGKPR